MRSSTIARQVSRASTNYLNNVKSPATTSTPQNLSSTDRAHLDAALRVDQAGEVAANYIYMGQMAVLGRDPKTGPLIQVSGHHPLVSRNKV